MLDRVLRFIRGNAIALVALFFALAGTGLGASRYLITSTSQIKPSALRQLRASPAAVAAALSKNGVHAVVDKARSTGPIEAGSQEVPVSVTMNGATWTQHPEEDQLLIGQVRVTPLTEAECGRPPFLDLEARVPDHLSASGSVFTGVGVEHPGETATLPILWNRSQTASLLQSGTTLTHTLEVRAYDACTGRHLLINEIALDVIGLH